MTVAQRPVADQMAELTHLAEFVEYACLSFATTAPMAPPSEGTWIGFWLVAHDLMTRAKAVREELENASAN